MAQIDARALRNAWHSARRAGVDLFSVGVLEALARLPSGSVRGLLSMDDLSAPRVSVLEALRALELAWREQASELCRAKVVATLPVAVQGVTTTGGTARNLIVTAIRELLLVGYAITDPGLKALLMDRAQSGVRITVVGDRREGGARQLWRQWPQSASPLVALENVEPVSGAEALMHGKVLVADREQMLVGSANFTAGGMARNLELGVKVEGVAAAEMCAVIDELHKKGWLIAVR